MGCKRICDEIGILGARYSDGVKYCRRCSVYFFHDGSFCPCCHLHLRSKPIRSRKQV